MRLAHDVAEMRVGGEGRRLVEDRLPHRRLHRFARLVVAEFEVLADFGVRDLFRHAARNAEFVRSGASSRSVRPFAESA